MKTSSFTHCGLERKKPRPDTFLNPFVDEMICLHSEGFTWQLDEHVRVTKVQFMTPYNGAFGYGFCEHEGKTVVHGNGHSRVFPLEEDLPPL